MKLSPFLSVAGLLMCGVICLNADTIPGHFEITFFGFPTGATFTATGSTTMTSTEGFTQNTITPIPCDDHDWYRQWHHWDWQYDWNGNCDDDPGLTLNGGHHSDIFNPAGTTFTTSPADFMNNGAPLMSVEVTVNTGDLVPGETFTCSSDIFAFCGIMITGDPTATFLFTDGVIPTATPEPAEGILLVIAFGAMVAARRMLPRKASA
jgi:hypothetical protein